MTTYDWDHQGTRFLFSFCQPPEEDPIDYCPFAAEFNQWAGVLVRAENESPNLISLNQAKLLLQEKFFEWMNVTPPRHAAHSGTRGKHECLFDVYVKAFGALKIIELRISKPPIYIPENAAGKPRRQRKATSQPEPEQEPPIYGITGRRPVGKKK